MQAELRAEEAKRELFDKQNEEDLLKKDRKVKGRQDLEKWSAERKKETE